MNSFNLEDGAVQALDLFVGAAESLGMVRGETVDLGDEAVMLDLGIERPRRGDLRSVRQCADEDVWLLRTGRSDRGCDRPHRGGAGEVPVTRETPEGTICAIVPIQTLRRTSTETSRFVMNRVTGCAIALSKRWAVVR